MNKGINRRGFLKTSTLGVLGAGVMGNGLLHSEEEGPNPEFPKIKEYRTLGRTGFKASDIGVGTSRQYPTPVIKALLDAGVNYIDTGERYGRGAAETSIGEAIKDRNRKSLFITTKLRLREEETKEQIISRFRKCLERLQTGYIDCLMLHNAPTKESLKQESFHQAVQQLKSEGKLRFIGVSNHGSRSRGPSDTMEKVLVAAAEDGRFDVILLIYNFLQKEQGEKILAACKKKDVGTTIMKSNPLGRYYGMKERVEQMKKEGKEVDERTKSYFERLKQSAEKAGAFIKTHNLQNPSEIRDAALRFVLDNPKVHVLNLAFNSFDDVENMLKLSGSRLNRKDKQKLAALPKGAAVFTAGTPVGFANPTAPTTCPLILLCATTTTSRHMAVKNMPWKNMPDCP